MEDTFGKLNFQAITFAYFRSQTTMEKAATFPSEKKKYSKILTFCYQALKLHYL